MRTCYLQDVESYLPGGLLSDGQHSADPFGTGSYGYDQSQVGIIVSTRDIAGISYVCEVRPFRCDARLRQPASFSTWCAKLSFIVEQADSIHAELFLP